MTQPRADRRPERLWPLFADLSALKGIGPKTAQLLGRMGIERPRDLILTLPQSVIDRRPVATIRGLPLPATATVRVTVERHAKPRTPRAPHVVTVRDAETSFHILFFHARAGWPESLLPVGQDRVVSGRIELSDSVARIVHPDHVVAVEESGAIPAHEPVYPLTDGLTSKVMAKAVAAALARAPELPEWIDPALLAQRGWLSWRAALSVAHAPTTSADLALTAPARERLAYDELFAHQLLLALARAQDRRRPGVASAATGRLRAKVEAALPYALTGAQRRALAEIEGDLAAPRRMNRLLQGDVGSGKTLVAFLALLAVVEAGGQGAMMAPTTLLAAQHLEALTPWAEAAGVRVALLTGRDKGAERARLLADLAAGRIDILVGTHALFQEGVAFADLRLAVIDEQHRFGVAQRMELGAKGQGTDVLVMTATPIPRSLALAQHGHMDVSVLDEKPPGRQPIATALKPMATLDEVVASLRRAVGQGARAYWVCPLVEESESVDLTAAETRAAHLWGALGAEKVGLVHGRLAPEAKDAVMADFVAGRIAVLVATTVIEVGVNVPEATIMVIERAESFGLAQLHQLRGRVGRGRAASTCLLLYEPPLGETARRRLTLLRETEDGFRLAEEDMALRGTGDLVGHAQSGLPRFRVADLERQGALMGVAQSDARALLDRDPGLTSPRGEAARLLLWLMGHDEGIRLLNVG